MLNSFKNLVLLSGIFVSSSLMCMEPEPKPKREWAHAIMKADRGYGTDWLEEFLCNGEGLNTVCQQTKLYPLAEIIRSRYDHDSSLIITGLSKGADVRLGNAELNWTLFHYLVGYPKPQGRLTAFLARKKLLCMLALAQHPGIIVDEKYARERIKTALLCLNRVNQGLKASPIKFCILGHLEYDIFNQKLFARVIEQRLHPARLVAHYPLDWLQLIASKATGDEKKAFIKKFAPFVAAHRLEKSVEVLAMKNSTNKTAYEAAKTFLQGLYASNPQYAFNKENPIINCIRQMERDLNPQDFVERHMPDCTKIVENMLDGKDPFDGFSSSEKEQ